MDRNELKVKFGEILSDVVGESFGALQDEQTLQGDLHLDSLDMVSMAIEVQAQIGVTIEPAEVTGIVTVGDLVDLVKKKMDGASPARAA